MRWAVLATAILMIVFLMEPLAQSGANKMGLLAQIPTNPYVFIDSPEWYQEDIYQTTSIPIDVHVHPMRANNTFGDIYYSLDGGPNIKLAITRYETTTSFVGKGTLNNLTNGYHTVKAYSTDTQGNTLSDSRTFLVNTTFRFPTLLLSPNNSTYSSKEILLTYTIDDPKYVVYYRLDNSGQIRLTGNTTLSGLSEGQHTITAHAIDFKTGSGIYSKQTANFTIDTTNPSPVPTQVPEPPAALGAVFLVIVVVALAAVYGRKYKPQFR